MKIYKFTKDSANAINNYNSLHSYYKKIMATVAPTNIGLLYIEAGGIVGMHEAPVPQLFIVMEGEGWVYGEDQKKLFIKQGEGVFWQKGEAHASESDKGLTALVLQASHIDLPE